MRFYTSSLLTKFGFEDGDQLTNILLDNGFELQNSEYLLRRIVRERILPVLDQKVEVQDIGMHNPIRAVSIDGINIDTNINNSQHSLALSPKYIDVDNEDIFEMITLKN
jgi:hypothetical protein